MRVPKLTSSSFDNLSTTRCGRGWVPTVKYVGRGTDTRSARRSETASSSSAKKFPVIIANEKLFFACNVVSFVNKVLNWPFTSPAIMLYVMY